VGSSPAAEVRRGKNSRRKPGIGRHSLSDKRSGFALGRESRCSLGLDQAHARLSSVGLAL